MRLMFAPRGSGTTERLKFAPHLAPRLLRIDAARLGCGMSMLTPTHPGAGGTPRNGLMAVDVAGVVDLAEQLDRASVGRARNGEPGDQLAASSSAEALHHTLRDFRDRPPPIQPVGALLHTGPEPAVAVGFDRGAGEVSPAGSRRKMAMMCRRISCTGTATRPDHPHDPTGSPDVRKETPTGRRPRMGGRHGLSALVGTGFSAIKAAATRPTGPEH